MSAHQVMVDTWTAGPLDLPSLEYDNIENPSVPLTDAIDYLDGWGTSSSGYNVNHSSILTNSAVWQAVTRISGDVAKLKLTLYSRTAEDGRERARREPAYRLVRDKSNEEMTAYIFWRRMLVHKLIWGNAYAFIIRNRMGQPMELLPLLPDRTEPRRREGKLYYVTEADFQLHEIPARDVFHLEGLCCDNLKGMDPTQAMRDAVGVALAGMGFAARFFRQGGRGGGILEVPANTTIKGKKNLEEGFSKAYDNVEAAFKTVVLRDGAKFHAAQSNMRDTQMVEGRKESVRDVARYFNLMPSKLGEESTVSYGSKSEDNRDYLDTTLDPHLCEIAAEANDKLLTPRQQSADSHYFEHNVDALLRMNTRERADVYALARSGGWMNANEIRKAENMPPIPGGDAFFNPAITQAPSEPGPDPVEAAARTLNSTARTASKAMGGKLLRAAGSGAGLCKWLDKKAASEVELMLGKCQACTDLMDSLTGNHPGTHDTWLATSIRRNILEPVAAIAESETEDTFRAALEALVAKVGGMDFTGESNGP